VRRANTDELERLIFVKASEIFYVRFFFFSSTKINFCSKCCDDGVDYSILSIDVATLISHCEWIEVGRHVLHWISVVWMRNDSDKGGVLSKNNKNFCVSAKRNQKTFFWLNAVESETSPRKVRDCASSKRQMFFRLERG
jgi:hypothetical protein